MRAVRKSHLALALLLTTAFLLVGRVAQAETLSNGSFETPNVRLPSNPALRYQYQPAGSLWTFDGNAGIAGNGSTWNAGGAVDNGSSVGESLSLEEVNGHAGIAYYQTTGENLKYAAYYP